MSKKISDKKLHKAYEKAESPEVVKAISKYYGSSDVEYAKRRAKDLLEKKKIRLKKININRPISYKTTNPLKSLLKRKKQARVYINSRPSERVNLMRWRW